MNIPLITRFKNVIVLLALSLPILLLAFLAPLVNAAAIITVDTALDDNTVNGNCTLREAVEAANTDTAVDACIAGNGDDSIIFDASTDGSIINVGTLGEITISSNLTVEGNGRLDTVISGSSQSRIFFIDAGYTVTLQDLKLSSGEATPIGIDTDGGAIYNNGATLTLLDMNIAYSNADDRGGAVYNTNSGVVLVDNALLRLNTADSGAAITNDSGIMAITNSRFTKNDARVGGAIYDNPLVGGGISLEIEKSTFKENTAVYGGALYLNTHSDSQVVNSTFTGNTASNSAAAISVMGGTTNIEFSTFTENTGAASSLFTGIGGVITLKANILNDTTSCSGVGTTATGGYNIENGDTCGLTFANDQINTDPELDVLDFNDGADTQTHSLLGTSPAIDSVDLAVCTESSDQAGNTRPFGPACDAGAYELNYTLVSIPPVATDDAVTTDENVAVDISILANDTDTDGTIDATSVVITNTATDGTLSVDAVTGEVTYTPDAGFTGTDQFTYTVDDNDGNTSNEATVTIFVNPVVVGNVAPVAADDSAFTDEDVAVLIDILANDTDADGTIDATTVTIVDQPLNATLSIDAVTGEVTFTPDTGFIGADQFTYTVEDNSGAISNLATVDVRVYAVTVSNIAPVANDDAANVDEDSNVLIDLLANDTDTDGTLDPATLVVVDQPLNGTVSINPVFGTVTYTPDTGFVGADSFTYTVNDDDGATSNIATVSITVDALPVGNVAPVANDDIDTTDEDTNVLVDVLANDTDSDGTVDTTTVTIIDAPLNGSVSVNATTGDVTYTPNAGFVGLDAFTYTVEDNDGATSNVATVTITVTEDLTETNEAPVANDDSAATDEDTDVDIDITANDFDTDGSLDVSSIDVTDGPFNGSVSINASNGVATYSPDTNFSGTDVFQYTIEDDEGQVSNVATVTITVLNVDNDAPVARDDEVDGEENEDLVIDVLANDTDDQDEIDTSTVDITNYPNDGSVSVNSTTGVVTYSPDLNFEGVDEFEYTVEDEDGNVSNEATVTIEVDNDGIIITGNNFDNDCYFHPFVDIDNHWVEDAIEGVGGLYCRNVVEGRDGTHYVPNDDVSRAEFLTILIRNLNVDILSYEDEGEDYADVDSSKWYYAYVVTGKELEIIDEEDFFRPNENINRAEAAAMMIRVVELTENLNNPSDDEPFDDVDDRDWYGDVIATAYEYDLVQGYSNDEYRPGNDLSRAEAAEMANNIFIEFYQ